MGASAQVHTRGHTTSRKMHTHQVICHGHALARTCTHLHSAHICTTWCWYFSPAVAPGGTPLCRNVSAAGSWEKGGLINGAPLSTAMQLCEALWLHIALLPNEAQLLDENDGFALELQKIMAPTLPLLSVALPCATLPPPPTDSSFCLFPTQLSCSCLWFAPCLLSCAVTAWG